MINIKVFRHTTHLFTLFAILAVLLLTGCVERKLTINTEPQGGLVFLNDEEIGSAPVTIEFNWYGDYKVHIEKQDYETLNTHRKLEAPLHDGFPLDFLFGVLWPGRIVDEYEWSFRLDPYQPIDRDALLQAAQVMKEKTNDEILQAQKEIELEKEKEQKKE